MDADALTLVLVVALAVAIGVIALLTLRLGAVLRTDPSTVPGSVDTARLDTARLDAAIEGMRRSVATDVERLTTALQRLDAASAERFGAVDRSLRQHAEAAHALTGTANDLRAALASSSARGQWGERMAEDVLRLAGLHEGVNYTKQTSLEGEGTGIPDFTFLLPRGQVLFMDVKFPMAAYLRYLEASTDQERAAHRRAFLNDVRQRIRELARRDYATTDRRPAVGEVLLFVPNESLAGFIHEADPALIDDAMRSHVVLCSPLTLFAFLGVIRQAHDNYMVEQTSHEILTTLGTFDLQWRKYTEAVERVKRQLDTVTRSFDELTGTRRRGLERPLARIEQLRTAAGVPDPPALEPGEDDAI